MKSIPESNTQTLVVDHDQVHLLSIIARLVSFDLPKPTFNSDSREMMARVKKKSFQLILLDLMMSPLWRVKHGKGSGRKKIRADEILGVRTTTVYRKLIIYGIT